MMFIENQFKIGQIVYLKTDKEQSPRIITGILISPTGITYRASNGAYEYYHYEIELQEDKDILITTTN